ncbi:MAG: GTP cyclohydrolase I FolE2 [Nitrososphaerota archaeon]|nr:GTP cyclohydrolase I FolE2 [Nitrososphaerota archaeon]MDG6942315.1 GTP cyclohydrolase I FolE2 [Nitrososphaerota archaeon]MDG6942780.1 GTP cyclohydrolase I FolE2 [Nitrososphaerota archaeon]MDG6948567.1 GTP cyclohydrolase I FolE2 [Nitrososphaerota archaeon]MDG6950493.1 GTP cyclohydrolase I FolE2 [Nitrososphaerota archaeon]
MRQQDRATDALDLIDATADVQAELSQLPVVAGIANLRVIGRLGNFSMPVELSIQTSTGVHRGVHMSRLVKAASSRKPRGMEQWLRWICKEVNQTQPGSSVTASFELPFEDQFAKVTMRATQRGSLTYRYMVDGMTACPCSKKMIGIGHMQRAQLTVVLKSERPLDSIGVVGRITECFSAAPVEYMKRLDEAKKILEAQANPKFAEDIVRECVSRFPNALYISGKCFESIHAHDAVATWSARPGWMPLI